MSPIVFFPFSRLICHIDDPQGFARLSAVYGGTYMLNKPECKVTILHYRTSDCSKKFSQNALVHICTKLLMAISIDTGRV